MLVTPIPGMTPGLLAVLDVCNVLEPPSPELMQQLTELQLCRPSDLRRARGRVRRLAYDLTAFDSVWIDSLVQLRLLTPHQAEKLEQGQGNQLRLGSFVIINELGHSPRGSTLLAKRLQRRDRCVVKRQQVDADRATDVARQMRLVIERGMGFAHPYLVLPHEVLSSPHHELITVSRYVPGLPLNELLVRRGRFPASVVLDIGRQLLEGLAALHARSLVHGDIRMSNVRLTDSGQAVLVEGGIRPVLHPEITIHNTLSLEAYDGLAPELIGTGAPASASSELYAVGCLLWQLLAGRPPFTTADPLAKIAAHQTTMIDDVRVWAPETPAALAEMILRMTSPAPQTRPRSFDEVLQRWGRSGSFGRSRLRQFRQLFNSAVPHFRDAAANASRSTGLIWLTATICALGGGVAVLYENGLRTELLEVVQKVRSVANPPEGYDVQTKQNAPTRPFREGSHESDRGPLPLPVPSPEGLILLTESGAYTASSVTFAGDLTIRAAAGVKTEIQIQNGPLTLKGQSVTLDRITVRAAHDVDSTMLLKIRSQQLTIENCEFVVGTSDAEASQLKSSSVRGTAALGWAPSDLKDAKVGIVSVKNTAFHGTGASILFGESPRSVTVENCLKTGPGPFMSFGTKCQAQEIRLVLEHVTLRETGPLLRLAGEPAGKTGTLPIQIEANECVFSLDDAKSGLVTIDCERPRVDLTRCVQLTSSDSIVTPGASLLTRFDPVTSQFQELDADDQFEGLSANGIEFAGPNSERAADSKTARLLGPRVSTAVDRLPGINSRQLGPGNREKATK